MQIRDVVLAVTILLYGASLPAAELTIQLTGSEPVTRKTIQYQCDAEGAKMGLPAEAFSVEYINGAGNSLAVLPVSGQSLIFSNVISGSGARYAARQYIWWDAAGRGTSFSSDSLAGKARSNCHRLKEY
jgi:membrane-bound inhibitor of C-type lysozyme